MTRTIYDAFGDEVTRADVDDNMPSLSYRRKLAAAPNCRDPDHPSCENCEDPETGEPLISPDEYETADSGDADSVDTLFPLPESAQAPAPELVSIAGFISCYLPEPSAKPYYTFGTMSFATDGWSPVMSHTITFELPAGFDPRAGVVETLRVQRVKMLADFQASIVAIDRKINEFLALELSAQPAKTSYVPDGTEPDDDIPF